MPYMQPAVPLKFHVIMVYICISKCYQEFIIIIKKYEFLMLPTRIVEVCAFLPKISASLFVHNS